MNTIDLLQEVRELLSDPQRWTKGAYARDDQGRTCDADHPSAVCFCLYGALMNVTSKRDKSAVAYRKIESALFAALREKGYSRIPRFNDSASHHEVLDLIDLAIELRKRK